MIVKGYKELYTVLQQLPLALSHEVIGKANVDAAKPLIEREKELVRVDKGVLKESIGAVRSSIKRASNLGETRVGPRRRGGKKGYHGHLVEFGTKERKTKKGASRGRMPAFPFAAPAFKQTIGAVHGRILDSLGRVTTRTMRRYIKNFS